MQLIIYLIWTVSKLSFVTYHYLFEEVYTAIFFNEVVFTRVLITTDNSQQIDNILSHILTCTKSHEAIAVQYLLLIVKYITLILNYLSFVF